jgi:hypothetical protein
MSLTTTTITQKYHDAIVDWQERNFPELEILMKHWDDHFKGVPPFQLVAKVGDLKSDLVEVGSTRQALEHAKEMVETRSSAPDVCAQCSTELRFNSTASRSTGVERQPNSRCSEYGRSPRISNVLVLDQDPTWKKPGLETSPASDENCQWVEVVLTPNIDFNDFLDNVTYATVIDLVGNCQPRCSRSSAMRRGPEINCAEGHFTGSGRKLLGDRTDGGPRRALASPTFGAESWYPVG